MATKTPQRKERKIIVTARARKAARLVVENLRSAKPKPHKIILSNAGYGKDVQNAPNRVLGTDGFKEALREMGLTEELITSSLVSDIRKKPKERLGELRLGAEILGMKQTEPAPPAPRGNIYNFIFGAEVQEKIRVMEGDIKKMLVQPNQPTS